MSGGYVYGSNGNSYSPTGAPNTATNSGASIYVLGTAKYDGAYGTGAISTTNNTLPDISSFQAKIGDKYYATLALAFTYADTVQTITVINNIPSQDTINIPAGKTITLTNDGNPRTITVSSESLFSVPSGATLIITGNSSTNTLTLKGIDPNNAPLINVISGTFKLNNNVIITGNKNINGDGGGGGVRVKSSGIFTMNGGKISDNKSEGTSYNCGGGVYVENGTFTMNDGEISNNESLSGAGVAINTGTFNMTNGVIKGNHATANSDDGGGVALLAGTFNMSGGVISGNRTEGHGGGVYIGWSGTPAPVFLMSGGIIYGSDGDSYIPSGSPNTAGYNYASIYVNGGTAKYSNGSDIVSPGNYGINTTVEGH